MNQLIIGWVRDVFVSIWLDSLLWFNIVIDWRMILMDYIYVALWWLSASLLMSVFYVVHK